MARNYGQQYPERPLMSTISDLLDIPHFSTSNGGTVRSDFLEAVAAALSVQDPTAGDKDAKIRRMWEAAQGMPMPDDRLSTGGTVTNTVLQEVVDGIMHRGLGAVAGPVDLVHGEEVRMEVGNAFDPKSVTDTRRTRVAEQAVRDGQSRFRTQVLEAYQGRCAVTGADVPAAIDAAHIAAYMGAETNRVVNGLALRTDLHRLFDRHLITVHEKDHRVIVGPLVAGSTVYANLDGIKLAMPRKVIDRPSEQALAVHRAEFESVAAD